MPIPDFDNTLTGRYIRALENPDSLGWNPKKRIWEAPKQRGTDSNNRCNTALGSLSVVGLDNTKQN